VLYDKITKVDSTVYFYIDTIQNSITYYYYLTSENNYGVESDSTPIVSVYISSVTKPLPPRGVTVFDTPDDNGGNLTLMWVYSEDEESLVSKVVGYNIYKSSDGLSFYPTYYFYNVAKTTYTYIDTYCPVGVTFYYYITAVNEHNLESEKTRIVSAYSIANKEVQDTQPPQPPTNITAFDYPNDDGKKVILIWTLSEDDGSGSNDVVKYKIYRSTNNENFVLHYEVPSGTTYYIDSSVLPNNTYWYYLTAVDKNHEESEPSQLVFVIPIADGVPAKPVGLTLHQKVLFDKIQVIISWDLPKEDIIVGYKIYKSSKTTDNFYLLKQIPKSTYYIDETCEPQEVYYYYITAISKYGYESEPSETKNITIEYKIKITAQQEVYLVFKKDERKLELKIEKGALLSDEEIKIEKVDITPQLGNSKPLHNNTYKLSPSELKFKTVSTIKIYFKEEDVKNITKEKLRIVFYDEETNSWYVLDTSKVNPNNNFVEAKIYQLGIYSVIEYEPVYSEIFKDEHVYAYPSPAKADKVYFKFLLYQPAKVKVYVYDIAGNFVWQSEQKEYKEEDVGKTHCIEWDIKNIATGLYIFRVEGKNEKQKKNVIKRFTIIH